MEVIALASRAAGAPLERYDYKVGPLAPYEVSIGVTSCGICHSDLSMKENHWHMTKYPFVPGHEVVGRVAEVGPQVTMVKPGDLVGLGWYARSCMHCEWCLGGDQNLCAKAEGTIVGRPGGFATHVRAHEAWAIPLPQGVDPQTAGPLFCGGITVFNPIVQVGLPATARVGVIGIGGLGHLALKFLRAWGCEVTAFSTTPDKEAEARSLGAHHFVATGEPRALKRLAGTLDFILVTVNVALDWDPYIAALRPKGRLHFVGAAPAVSSAIFPLLVGQKSISASPLGSIQTTRRMLDFCARHQIAPMVERFPMSQANEALARLEHGKPRYRIILDNDLAA